MSVAKKSLVLALTSALLAAGLCACERGTTPGQKLDRAIDKTGEGIDKALDKTGEKLKEAGEAIQPK
jgi:hypothetical protein